MKVVQLFFELAIQIRAFVLHFATKLMKLRILLKFKGAFGVA